MDLINRLKFFMESQKVTISQFADTCGIPRPTLSQLMNGRNKRVSDEIINKIHNGFPSLSILWLMFGEGAMDSAGNIEISEPQRDGISTDSEMQAGGNQGFNLQESSGSGSSENLSTGKNGAGVVEGMEYNLFREDIDGLNSDQAAFQAPHLVGQQVHHSGTHQHGNSLGSDEIDFNVHPNDITRTLFTSAGRQAKESDGRTAAPQASPTSPHAGSAAAQTVTAGVHTDKATGMNSISRQTMNSGSPAALQGQQNRQPQQPAGMAGALSNAQTHPSTNTSNSVNNSLETPLMGSSSARRISMAQSGINSASGAQSGRNHDGSNNDTRNVIASARDGSISISPDSRKKITNIVVFYSDNSFQSFIPD